MNLYDSLYSSLCGWRNAKNHLPTEEGDILFIAKPGLTTERMGPVVLDRQLVLLKHTDISFSDLLWWIPIPPIPE